MSRRAEAEAEPVAGDGPRLLLDPYLCVGPGTEHHAETLAAIAGHGATLGIPLCVEQSSWEEAATDPDVVRRRVALWRFEPLVRIPDLPLPSQADLEAHFVPARNEIDRADLKLLGALHANRVELLIADDGRLHRLAARAGLTGRVLTPADALAWLESLAGRPRELAVADVEPRAALATPTLERMLTEECAPFDPYLAAHIEAPGTRVLVASEGGRPVSLAVLTGEGAGPLLAAVATAEGSQGQRTTEPLVAAALAHARRERMPLTALAAPHQDHLLLLLDALGFERAGRDRHGRDSFRRPSDEGVARPLPGRHAWLWPLDAGSQARLVPELAGATQAELFAGSPAPPPPGARIRRLLIATPSGAGPEPGDLLLLFHVAGAERIRSAVITAAARVTRRTPAGQLKELVALTAGHDSDPIARLRELAAAGPASVIELRWLGRLARPLSLSALIEREVIAATPAAAVRLAADGLRRLGAAAALA